MTDNSSQNADHHDDHHGFAHIMPPQILLGVFFSLLFLTFATVAATYLELGRYEIWVSMGIATIKAALVVFFFMHLLYDKPLNGLIFFLTFGFVALFIGFTVMDSLAYKDRVQEREYDLMREEILASAVPLTPAQMFQQNCAVCHQVETAVKAPSLKEILSIHKGKPEQIVQWAINPGRKRRQYAPMPTMKHVGEGNLQQIAEYMLALGAGEVQELNDPNWIKNLTKSEDETVSDEEKAKLEAEVVATVMETEGDVKVGEKLFVQQTCASCHRPNEGQIQVGPKLADLKKRMPKEKIIDSILHPSAEISKGYEVLLVVTIDGLTVTGMEVSEQDAEILKLRQMDGKIIEMPADDALDKVPQTMSQMPKGLVGNITPKQFADLVAYLQSL